MRKDHRPRLAKRVTSWGTTWKVAFYGQRPDFNATDTPEDNDEQEDDD